MRGENNISDRAAIGKKVIVALHGAILHHPTCPHLFTSFVKTVVKDLFS